MAMNIGQGNKLRKKIRKIQNNLRLSRMKTLGTTAQAEMEMIDLYEYENRAVMVRGDKSGDWIYDAELIETSGPILSAVVREVIAE